MKRRWQQVIGLILSAVACFIFSVYFMRRYPNPDLASLSVVLFVTVGMVFSVIASIVAFLLGVDTTLMSQDEMPAEKLTLPSQPEDNLPEWPSLTPDSPGTLKESNGDN